MVPELVSETPLRLYLPPGLEGRARELLTVVNRSADFALKRLRKTRPWQVPRGDNAKLADYEAEERRLLAKRDRQLLFQDGNRWWTYTGLRDYLAQELLRPMGVTLPHRRAFDLPEMPGIPWHRTPKQVFGSDPFDHQAQGAQALLEAGHAAADFATGSGKSLMLALCVRTAGVRAAVVVYSVNIAQQLYALFVQLLGEKYVGLFDGDHKQVGKLITVCTAMAVHNLKLGTPAYIHFAGCQLLAGDESHTFAAAVLQSLAEGVFAAAPLRIFTSATQMRGDGLGLLLRGIIGPTVAEMPFRQAVEGGFLARPEFYMVSVPSRSNSSSSDMDRMTRDHVYLNPDLAAAVGRLAAAYNARGWANIVLAEEFPQVELLLQHLPLGTKVLHGNTGIHTVTLKLDMPGGTTTEDYTVRGKEVLPTNEGKVTAAAVAASWARRERRYHTLDLLGNLRTILSVRELTNGQYLLPPELRDCDVPELCREFSTGDLLNLVTTSAGRVGVDLTPPRPTAVHYLVAGTSETNFVQGVGRGARRKGKAEFHILDYRVQADRLGRHADERAEVAERLWGSPREVGVEELLGLVSAISRV